MNLVYFHSDSTDVNKAYYTAVSDLVANIRPFCDGILKEKAPVIIAGYGYTTPWTRDAAINTMNAGSLLCPEEAKNTLFAVLEEKDGELRIGGEYWDAVIWTWGAWEYYRVTADIEFLQIAFAATKNTMNHLEITEFDPEKNLFRGAACYGDGVAAYPDVYASHGRSGIITFAETCKEMCADNGVGLPMFALSTNCLYFHVYVLLDRMAKELSINEDYSEKARAMKAAVNRHFWMEKEGRYRYLVDPFGNCDSMEGMGNAFALLLGIADAEQAEQVLENQHITPGGISCLWPTFTRYRSISETDYGRHSGTVWPHIQSFWADAALQNGRPDLFDGEFWHMTQRAVRDGYFAEIYHPDSGTVYGGVQEDKGEGIRLWESCKKQTWSATGYLRMIFFDLLGMNFEQEGVRFTPYLPEGVSVLEVSDISIRGKKYHICVRGTGHEIQSFMVNGTHGEPFIPFEHGDVIQNHPGGYRNA